MRSEILLALLALIGCTSTKLLSDQTFTKENLSAQLNVEDRIWVQQKEGNEYRNMIIDSIEETYLLGHDNESDILIIPYSSIRSIEKHYYSKGKTFVLLAIPISFVIAAVIAVASGAALSF
jgi:hypothetical protein